MDTGSIESYRTLFCLILYLNLPFGADFPDTILNLPSSTAAAVEAASAA